MKVSDRIENVIELIDGSMLEAEEALEECKLRSSKWTAWNQYRKGLREARGYLRCEFPKWEQEGSRMRVITNIEMIRELAMPEVWCCGGEAKFIEEDLIGVEWQLFYKCAKGHTITIIQPYCELVLRARDPKEDS